MIDSATFTMFPNIPDTAYAGLMSHSIFSSLCLAVVIVNFALVHLAQTPSCTFSFLPCQTPLLSFMLSNMTFCDHLPFMLFAHDSICSLISSLVFF